MRKSITRCLVPSCRKRIKLTKRRGCSFCYGCIKKAKREGAKIPEPMSFSSFDLIKNEEGISKALEICLLQEREWEEVLREHYNIQYRSLAQVHEEFSERYYEKKREAFVEHLTKAYSDVLLKLYLYGRASPPD